MKKIFIFALTAVILITSLLCIVGARNEENYYLVLEFQETNKAYPLMASLDDCIGFKSYYQLSNFSFSLFPNELNENRLCFYCTSTGIVISYFFISGTYPIWDYILPQNEFDDVGLYYDEDMGDIIIVGFTNGEAQVLTSFAQVNNSAIESYDYVTSKESMREGYFVEFPKPQEPPFNDHIITPIIDSVGSFVLGIGGAFAVAFESVFMVDGQLNALSIFLFVIMGCALAYGCIRWITGLFRKET